LKPELVKKVIIYLGIFVMGIISTLLVTHFLKMGPSGEIGKHSEVDLQDKDNIKRFKNNPKDLNSLLKGMQKSFQDQDSTDLSRQHDDLMGQFMEMRKKMLQMYEEEGGGQFGVADTLGNIDSREDEQNYYFDLNMENIDQSSLKIDFKDGYLTLKGEMRIVDKEESNFGQSESTIISNFSKTVTIPDDANVKMAQVNQKDKTLTIVVPKKK
jgi:HSP20 family protein